MKKKWQTPELIVLARSNPEEAILETCKYGSLTGDAGANSRCFNSDNGSGWCYNMCLELKSS